MKGLLVILIALVLTSCNSTKPVSGTNWTIQVPSNWQVSKRNTGYQITSPNLPGVLQISSHPYFKTEVALENHISNWPDKFIKKQGAVKQKEEKVKLGDAAGRYIEYSGKDKSNWLSWWLRKGKMFIAITYINENLIHPERKQQIKDIIQTIKIKENH